MGACAGLLLEQFPKSPVYAFIQHLRTHRPPRTSDVELEEAINVLRGVKIGHRQFTSRLHCILQAANLDDLADFLDALSELGQHLTQIRSHPTWPTETTVIHDLNETRNDNMNEQSPVLNPSSAPDGPASPDPEQEQYYEVSDDEPVPHYSDISD